MEAVIDLCALRQYGIASHTPTPTQSLLKLLKRS